MVKFQDHGWTQNPKQGCEIVSGDEVVALIDGARIRPASFVQFVGKRHRMLVGVGRDLGCIQLSRFDGDAPYEMATNENLGSDLSGEYMEYDMGGTATPIPTRFNIPIDVVKRIVRHFVETEERSNLVTWEEI